MAAGYQKEDKPTRRLVIPYLLKIAAGLLVFILAGWAIYSLRNSFSHSPHELASITEKVTLPGERQTVKLPDGSTVILNVASKITFPSEFEDDIREVRLEGEAFFQVTKDPEKPFVVRSGNIVTRVLGTSFNVLAYPQKQKVQVTVATGKVQVKTKLQENSTGEVDALLRLYPRGKPV